jgi:rhamnosyltransferase subunit B
VSPSGSGRVLLATFGSLGDLHPYIAVGRALQARGVPARVASTPEYRAAVEGAGLEFAPMRPSIELFGTQAEIARRLFHPLLGVRRLLCDYVMPHLRDTCEDLERAAVGTDLFVSHPLTYPLPMIAQRQGKPWLSSVLAPMSLLSRHDPPVVAGFDVLRWAHRQGPATYQFIFGLARRAVRRWENPLHAFRIELGLPPTAQVMTFEGQFSPFGTLALFDPVLAQPQSDWPVRTQACGAALFDGEVGANTHLDDLQRFLDAGEAPIVFALGSSAVWIAGDFWVHAIAAAQRLGRRAILLAGGAMLPPLPEGICAFDYVPYSQVFPQAVAVVHQAGIGTLSQALRAGRPQLITPVAFDQPDNAARATRLGVGRVLPFSRVTADRLHAELQHLLAEPAYTRAALDVAGQLRAIDGAAAAADRIMATMNARPD